MPYVDTNSHLTSKSCNLYFKCQDNTERYIQHFFWTNFGGSQNLYFSWEVFSNKREFSNSDWLDPLVYGTTCVGRIVTKSMFYFLHLCDCNLPFCATLEAWNWFVAGQHNVSHPRSPVWPNQMSLFSGNNFLKNFKRSLLLTR